MVNLNELKGGSIRCIIPYKDNEGNKHEIEVYNIIGERRKQILEELAGLIGDIEKIDERTVDSYYTDLIMEFTNIKIDDTNINDIIANPTLEWNILMHELNEMIYELQYEEICNQVIQARTLVLESMRQQIEMELAIQTDFLNRSNEKFIKQLKDLGIGEE